ncbi:MAG: hypothetical protein ABWX85_02835 [Arthrobacter sp.]
MTDSSPAGGRIGSAAGDAANPNCRAFVLSANGSVAGIVAYRWGCQPW